MLCSSFLELEKTHSQHQLTNSPLSTMNYNSLIDGDIMLQ